MSVQRNNKNICLLKIKDAHNIIIDIMKYDYIFTPKEQSFIDDILGLKTGVLAYKQSFLLKEIADKAKGVNSKGKK